MGRGLDRALTTDTPVVAETHPCWSYDMVVFVDKDLSRLGLTTCRPACRHVADRPAGKVGSRDGCYDVDASATVCGMSRADWLAAGGDETLGGRCGQRPIVIVERRATEAVIDGAFGEDDDLEILRTARAEREPAPGVDFWHFRVSAESIGVLDVPGGWAVGQRRHQGGAMGDGQAGSFQDTVPT